MNPRPLVSVILPINIDYGYFDDAVASILSQSYNNIELLIIANNCDDVLWEKILSFKDSRIRCFRVMLGQLPYSLNFGIENSFGSYIARMDADDISEPNRIEMQVQFLEKNPDIDIVGTSYIMIDEYNNIKKSKVKLFLTPEQIKKNLPWQSCMPHPTVMFSKSSIVSVGGYAFGHFAEDWDLWLRMNRLGFNFSNLPQPLLKYRIHFMQSTSDDKTNRNVAYVLSLLIREFMITGNPVYIASSIKYFFVCHFQKIKKYL